MKLGELFRQQKADRNDRGFNMLELIMVVVVIGILGGIGFAIYQGISDEARGTVLDTNITTAAEQLQGVLSVDPTLAGEPRAAALAAEMTNRTNFVWIHDAYAFPAVGGDAAVVRFQWLRKAATGVAITAAPTTGASGGPVVDWVVDDASAVRLHIRNAENQWRCALVVMKPSLSVLGVHATTNEYYSGGDRVYDTASSTNTETNAKLAAAEISGLWFDGGSPAAGSTYDHLHDCSPSAENDLNTCTAGTAAAALKDTCLPENANSWNIPVRNADWVDPSSTLGTSRNTRTLHGEIGQLDSNA